MVSETLAPWISRILDRLQRYHNYRVEGLEYVPVTGPALLVLHHSLATYDSMLLAVEIWHRTGRAPAGLGHNRLFSPGLRAASHRLGLLPASPEAGRRLLSEGKLVLVAPGGMREALRPSSERYQFRWEKRRGFVRLALEMQVPMVLAACPRADELFEVNSHPLTEWVYDNFRWPLPIAKGRGGLPVPRKVPLVHYVAPPIVAPKLEIDNMDKQIDELHVRATQVMAGLLERR
ncbi:MAG: acyltransferase family protein [Myxococcales bacterium]|nr:acyltransferase family protein [Myxococcales bacterium]